MNIKFWWWLLIASFKRSELKSRRKCTSKSNYPLTFCSNYNNTSSFSTNSSIFWKTHATRTTPYINAQRIYELPVRDSNLCLEIYQIITQYSLYCLCNVSICGLFSDAVCNSDYMASKMWMTVNNELKWIWKEVVIK